MLVLTSAEMKQAEADAVKHGATYEELMENAGFAASEAIKGIAYEVGCEESILLLAGKGNNGGDAFVVARLLAEEGWQVSVLPLCGREFSPLAAQTFAGLPQSVKVFETLEQAVAAKAFTSAVVCDGVFGTGFGGALPGAVAEAFRVANAAETLRVALDLPSGLDPDAGHIAADTFVAAHTLTFGAYKPGLVMDETETVRGEVHLLDIGL